MADRGSRNGRGRTETHGITRITVRGYKSLSKEQSIEVRPLTVLAGANSSGKSSIMQPLLLMKQTLEAPFDPGTLRLDGPNLEFTKAAEFLSRRSDEAPRNFSIALESEEQKLETKFSQRSAKPLAVASTRYSHPLGGATLKPNMAEAEIRNQMVAFHPSHSPGQFPEREFKLFVERERCFLRCKAAHRRPDDQSMGYPPTFRFPVASRVEPLIPDVIHLPGLRGNPERLYPVSAVGSSFPGRFDQYAASVIAHWDTNRDSDSLSRLNAHLTDLALTWKVQAKRIEETRVELKVGRLPRATRGDAHDLVNIADVGFGVSQSLPVLVALLVARPGQLVYLEQPEIHLHPRAQTALASVIAEAARRGVRVVVETHGDLLLLGIQTLVAEGKFPADQVKFHWFERSEDGVTKVTSADLDENGAFGDWPMDFADVRLDAQSRYLDAAELPIGGR